MPGEDIKRQNTFNIVPHTHDGKVYSTDADESDDTMQYKAICYTVDWPKPLNHQNKKAVILCPFCRTKVQFADNYIPKIDEVKDCSGCDRHLKVSNIIPLGDQKLQDMQNSSSTSYAAPNSGKWEQ